MEQEYNKKLVVVRGGGDIASGTIMKLYQCGFQVLVLESERPSSIRRQVSFSEAVYEGFQKIEGVTCYLARSVDEALFYLKKGKLAMLVDPEGACLERVKPYVVVDAILAKKNLGTHKGMAPITIGLGPGFVAGNEKGFAMNAGKASLNIFFDEYENGADFFSVSSVHGEDSDRENKHIDTVDAVIETMRGHTLGRVIYEGSALPNTGIPGMIGGYAAERVIYSPAEGVIQHVAKLTGQVKKGDVIAYIRPCNVKELDQELVTSMLENGYEPCEVFKQEKPIPVYATLDGTLRGLIREGYPVTKGFKIADVDPRVSEYENSVTISDKARCIAGGVLEVILHLSLKL